MYARAHVCVCVCVCVCVRVCEASICKLSINLKHSRQNVLFYHGAFVTIATVYSLISDHGCYKKIGTLTQFPDSRYMGVFFVGGEVWFKPDGIVVAAFHASVRAASPIQPHHVSWSQHLSAQHAHHAHAISRILKSRNIQIIISVCGLIKSTR